MRTLRGAPNSSACASKGTLSSWPSWASAKKSGAAPNWRNVESMSMWVSFGKSRTVVTTFDGMLRAASAAQRSEEHTSELQSRRELVCRLLLEKKKSLDHQCYRGLPPQHTCLR